jgi:hypothetical protein
MGSRGRSRWFSRARDPGTVLWFIYASALFIHPCLNVPESAGLVNPVQFCDLAKRLIRATNHVRRTQMVGKIELRTLDKSDTRHDVGVR